MTSAATGPWPSPPTTAAQSVSARPSRPTAVQGKPTDFWSLDLPAETENYVPQLLAIAQVVAAPARYGLAMPRVPDRPQLELVHAVSQVDLDQAARLADLSPAALSQLNPGLKQGKTQPSGPHTLLVPAGSGQRLQLRLAGATSTVPMARPAVAVIAWGRLSGRQGGEPDDHRPSARGQHRGIALANGLKSNKVAAGTRLLVPTADLSEALGPAASRWRGLHRQGRRHPEQCRPRPQREPRRPGLAGTASGATTPCSQDRSCASSRARRPSPAGAARPPDARVAWSIPGIDSPPFVLALPLLPGLTRS